MAKKNLTACLLAVALTLPISLAATAANASVGYGAFYKKEYRDKVIKEDRYGNRKIIKTDRYGNRKIIKTDRYGNREVIKKNRYGNRKVITHKRRKPSCEKVVIRGPFGGKFKKRVCD